MMRFWIVGQSSEPVVAKLSDRREHYFFGCSKAAGVITLPPNLRDYAMTYSKMELAEQALADILRDFPEARAFNWKIVSE